MFKTVETISSIDKKLASSLLLVLFLFISVDDCILLLAMWISESPELFLAFFFPLGCFSYTDWWEHDIFLSVFMLEGD